MSRYQSPRGTRDILPADQTLWHRVKQVCEKTAHQFAYQAITIPTFEEVGLFQRSIGQGTDIIDKELFLVEGRTEESSQYALRPEGTAGIVRAFIQHGMQTWPQPVKLYTTLNNFRYERPQKGRYREHTQFDIEYFGDKGPFADAWVIFTQWSIFQQLSLENIHLEINSLGTKEERQAYIAALVQYLEPHIDQLSDDSKRRLTTNPLRILDSKDASDQNLLQSAPQLSQFLGETSQAHIRTVKEYLSTWNVPYRENEKLVRGLDYYCHTCFEWVQVSTSGTSLALGGGGRYDGLLPQLEGPDSGAVGAGMGLDRLVEILRERTEDQTVTPSPRVYVIADPSLQAAAQKVLLELITADIPVDADFSRPSFGSQLKAASRSGATIALILGAEEYARSEVLVKDLTQGTQEAVALDQLLLHIRPLFC